MKLSTISQLSPHNQEENICVCNYLTIILSHQEIICHWWYNRISGKCFDDIRLQKISWYRLYVALIITYICLNKQKLVKKLTYSSDCITIKQEIYLKVCKILTPLSFLIYKFFCLYILANLYSNRQATLYVGAYAIFANIDKTPGFLIKMIYLTVLNWLPQWLYF